MPSSYTDNLALELQATGENDGTWGDKLNTVITNVDTAIAGLLSKSVAGASDVTLTAAEALHAVHKYTGALTGNINVIVPTVEQKFFVENATTGAYTLTVKTSGGTGIAVPQGQRKILYADGTNVVDWIDAIDVGTLTSTDPGAAVAPVFTLHRNSASPAADDVLGSLNFDGEDDSSNQTTFAAIRAVIRDPVNASEDGDLQFYLMSAATLTKFMELLRTSAVGLRLIDDGAGAGAGPDLFLHRNSASPIDNDAIGRLVFEGEDDGSTRTEYASIEGIILDVTDATEDGRVAVKAMVAGSLSTIGYFDVSGLTMSANRGLVLNEGTAPSTGAGQGVLYTKDTAGQPELFYREESDGDEVQLTDGGSVGSSVAQATAGAIEAETDEDTYIPPDLLFHSDRVAKVLVAGVYVTGTPTANNSGNGWEIGVDSLDDNGTGDIGVNFTTAFASAHYVALVNGHNGSTTSDEDSGPYTRNTTSVEVTIQAASNNADNPFSIACFGDQ